MLPHYTDTQLVRLWRYYTDLHDDEAYCLAERLRAILSTRRAYQQLATIVMAFGEEG
jgi:hypothetical protein